MTKQYVSWMSEVLRTGRLLQDNRKTEVSRIADITQTRDSPSVFGATGKNCFPPMVIPPPEPPHLAIVSGIH